MTLEINFYCSVFIKDIPLVSEGIHLLVDDGCEVWLDKDDESLTELQKENIIFGSDDRVKKHLIYLNTRFVEGAFNDGKLRAHCPVCGKNYIINKKDYDLAYQKFITTKQESEIID